MKRSALFLLALTSLPLAAGAQESNQSRSNKDFNWEGRIPKGRWLYLRNLNGDIRVERATGDKVEVTAEKRWRRGDPADVTIEVKKATSNGDDVLICAIWFENTRCDEDGYRVNNRNGWGNRNNDVSIRFTVKIPDGVKLDVSSVNGELRIDGASSEVQAHTVNGNIDALSSGGPVNASTVNGGIEVRMRDSGAEDLEFQTVNGSITVIVPDNLNAEVDMRTVNGHVESDFPMTVSGRISSKHIRATVGKGGRKVKFETVNGSVRLRKSA